MRSRSGVELVGAEVILCRLTADLSMTQQRLRTREPGMLQEQCLAWAPELERVLDGAPLEDFNIANENCSVTNVAAEMLKRADWIDDAVILENGHSAAQP
jgi:hypothetical protein